MVFLIQIEKRLSKIIGKTVLQDFSTNSNIPSKKPLLFSVKKIFAKIKWEPTKQLLAWLSPPYQLIVKKTKHSDPVQIMGF